MSDVIEAPMNALVIDLLSSLAAGARPYGDVMSAWRTSCPRLPVWEEVNDRGFVARLTRDGRQLICITPRGADYLKYQA